MDPASLSNLFYYVENLALACGLLFIAVLFALGKSQGMKDLARWEPETLPGRYYRLRRFLRWLKTNRTRIGGFILFFFGSLVASVFAIHAILAVPLLQDGVWVWYLQVLRVPQIIGVWIFLRGLSTPRKYKNSPPDKLQPPK